MEMALSAATGALQPVLGKLATLAGDEYKRLKGIRGEIDSLSRELAAMDAFLEKMSAEEEDPKDKVWMSEVRELSYDVEDNLDDFMARVDARPDGFMGKIKGLVGRTKARHQIAKAIEDLKRQAVEVSQRNDRYRIGATPSAAKVDDRALVIFKNASKLVGVDGPKKEIIQLLAGGYQAGSGTAQQLIKMVAVVGAGGLGKTTLANQVYQEELKVKGRFDCHAFQSVSRYPDLTKVMSNILGQLDKDHPTTGTEDLPQLITKIRDFLTDKRYFIVVDDIWKAETWDVINCAFPSTNYGSKIITTTRINVVAESCCSSFSGHIHNIRPLSIAHSRKLFYGRLFDSEEKCLPHLQGISDQILEKCAGLPLAIIAIAGLLANKASKEDQWEKVKDSVGRALRKSSLDVMVNVISLSYLDLPRHLRTCLLYLSIFPEDHIINKENLIKRWVGEGFIHKKAAYTLHESGEMCFNELINRSLIQPAEVDKTFGHEVKSCRVHDTVLDFIVSKAVEENFVTIVGVPDVDHDGRNKVRRLSLQNGGEVPAGLVLSNARSVHVFGGKAKIPSLSEFRLLRVLDYDCCWQLKDDNLAGIGNLLHLKYLRFNYVPALVEFPEEVARLPQLEIDLHRYSIETEIPETICHLQQFVTLTLDREAIAGDEITAMEELQVLEGVNVYSQSSKFLGQLGQLRNLRKLGIIFNTYDSGGDWEEMAWEAASSISELAKANLESLHIKIDDMPNEILEEFGFIDPLLGLRELVVKRATLIGVPAWIASLADLEKLRLPMAEVGEEDMEILGSLPSLRHLCIEWGIGEEDDEGPKQEAAMKRVLEAHPNRPALVWIYMNFLPSGGLVNNQASRTAGSRTMHASLFRSSVQPLFSSLCSESY